MDLKRKRKCLRDTQKRHLCFFTFFVHLSLRRNPANGHLPLREALLSRQVSVCLCQKKKNIYIYFTHSNKNLSPAVSHLDVLVVYEAAHHGDVGVALRGADPRSLLHLVPHAARPVFAPPRVVGWDVERQQVTVLEGRQKSWANGLWLWWGLCKEPCATVQ